MTVCRHLDVQPDKAGRFVHHRDSAYRCLAPDPVLPAMPASITRAPRFSAEFNRTFVSKDMCADCPVRVEREKGD